jgi:BirA family biotin operon repressor/biotin-[acetyl-CoA-carboxylase] ligase
MPVSVPDRKLLSALADGRFCSGQQLANDLGVSRAAVWKRLQRLRDEFGLGVEAVPGRGYRLPYPLELIDRDRLLGRLRPGTRRAIDQLIVAASIDSTNTAAMSAAWPPHGKSAIWVAEHQTAGRGRRGRTWASPFGASLYLTVARRFERSLGELSGLSLATGVIVAETLTRLGVAGVGLKWPNDLVVDGRKLAGILVEASGEAGGPALAAIGLGVNVRMPTAAAGAIDQPWADLTTLPGGPPSRNDLCVELIEVLVEGLEGFAEFALDGVLERWRRFDVLADRSVEIHTAGRRIEGIYRGISDSGGALIETVGEVVEHFAGEVSLRPAAR